jgi:hypothetical protein
LKKYRTLTIISAVVILVSVVAVSLVNLWKINEIHGMVMSGGRPMAGVTVSIQTTSCEVTTGPDGEFTIKGFKPNFYIPVTAWADGYYIGGKTVFPWEKVVILSVSPYSITNNPSYSWISPQVKARPVMEDYFIENILPLGAKISFRKVFLPSTGQFNLGCADCHNGPVYDQYAADAHALGTKNFRFMTMYNGTDVKGHKSPLTRYGASRDYGTFPLPPDSSQPWFGPGFKLDFPDQAGNCATCHMPGEAIDDPLNTDINQIPPTAVQGTHCDFCHKIASVTTDPNTHLPFENSPGVLSMQIIRPQGDQQVFFGPYDDVDVGPDTRLPLQSESLACAACHNASFWGTPVYQSYSEWLNSQYAREGVTCQSCHMTPDGVTQNFAPGKGGQDRDPQTVFSHNFPGAADETLLQNTAKLELTGSRQNGLISIEARVTNENGGHDIPTDSPLRNIILVVEALDQDGHALNLEQGPVIPDWGGVGDQPGDYAGKPGKGYAKVLEELWTEVSPTAAYWRQTRVLQDNRIHARETDLSKYAFRETPVTGPVTINAQLIFRRAFKEIARQKGWNDPDILMEQIRITVP